MKCYYEELNIARDASDGDIKTAYRKLALRWHPDKNPENLEEAKEKFQVIQQAYEVLSDQHERAWYDNHREQILRGKNSEYEENCLDLFQYFTVSCFKGYGDDEKGFYKTYAEVFEKIAAEDAEFMDDEEEILEIPKFGDSTSSYEDVVGPFYAYWQSYCTKKTYTWLCEYDIKEIKDRRVLRVIEKDLKKVVQKAKRERNEEVRNLVSFIRKRDKRVQANKKLLEEKAALNRQKQEQNRLEQIRKRNRELEEMRKANSHVSNEGYEEQLKQLEQEYDGDEEEEIETDDSNSEDKDEHEYIDDLYCVACNRAFSNGNAFINHETSKKHRENIEKLKLEMLEEEECFEDSSDVKENGEVGTDDDVLRELPDEIDDHTDEFDDLSEDLKGSSEDVNDLDNHFPENHNELEDEKVEKDNIIPSRKNKGKKNKKAKNIAKIEQEEVEKPDEDTLTTLNLGLNIESDDDEWGKGKRLNKKSKAKKTQKKVNTEESSKDEGISNSKKESSNEVSNKSPNLEIPSLDPNHVCVTCNSTFQSKNKLFTHLKKTNHGVYIPKVNPKVENQSAKKSKGKRK